MKNVIMKIELTLFSEITEVKISTTVNTEYLVGGTEFLLVMLQKGM